MLIFLISCSKTPESTCCPKESPTSSTVRDSGTNVVAESTQQDRAENETAFEEPLPEGFVDCSECIEGNPSHRRYGIAVTDFNRDGDFEAVVTGYGASNEVWDWQNEGLVNIATNDMKDSNRKAIGVGACDVDADGQEEIYFLNVDQFGGLGEVTDRLYDNTEDGWIDLFELDQNLSQVNRFSGRSVACVDRFGTGDYGVFVANYGGPMKIFEVADNQITDVGSEAGINLTTGGRALLSLPIFEDGMHIFAGNEQGANFLFRNDGDGSFTNVAQEVGIQDSYETVRGTTTLDIDDDGDFDLVYGNWEGPHRMWSWNGTTFDDVTPATMQIPSRIRTIIAADFDNDGDEELFFNNIGEANRLFEQDINGSWIEADIGDALETDGLGTGAAVLDIDNDGRLELLVAHGESGEQPLSLYRWPENNNHYIRVFPKTIHGAPARGAVVTVKTEGKTHIRSIDAGSGYLCQMEPVAHVGLGQGDSIQSVEVVWPGAERVLVESPSIDQLLTIPHPGSE